MEHANISIIYDLLIENIPRLYPDTKMTVQELKYIGDLFYNFIIREDDLIKDMRNSYVAKRNKH